jgi:SAM-dependent methyltransferase
MFRIIIDETRKMARDPRRLREVLRPRRWRQFFSVLRFDAKNGGWKPAAEGEQLRRRDYSSYDEYVRHQQSKFQYLDLEEYDRNYQRVLGERLQKLTWLKQGATVLCLGARQGTEVKAFLDLGCFAVGVDLMPGAGNRYVVQGDFHHLEFPAESADVVFTNSMDHAFDPKKMLGEISRVLKADGRLIVEAMQGEKEGNAPDSYASLAWQSVDDLVALLKREGFTVEQRASFSEPWPGEQICLVKGGKG